MRLSTAADRDESRAVDVIHAALDAGATLLDTADAYCHDDRERGHNERLIAQALDTWDGDRAAITVATKGGMRRPKGAWVPDGRARHLRDACDASREALGVETIDLYQLHAVDPKTPLETSVRALAKLRDDGKVREVGLCNVTVSQIRAAQEIVPIASVQVSLSPFDDENLRNGVAEYCRDSGIPLIAHRPLGGARVKKLERDAVLSRIATKHGVESAEAVLAWLVNLGAIPIPGATRVETAASIARVLRLELDEEDRGALDERFSGRLLRVGRRERMPDERADGDVVVIMGMPGAGKSTVARELEAEGYERLNRDETGGSLSGLVQQLDHVLASGARRAVLDNTYPSRASRNEVIEAAWAHGVPVRCIWLSTAVGDAQINSIHRMLDAHRTLPTPEEIRALGRKDTRYLAPDAQFRYERTVEPPTQDEGFTRVEQREFVRDHAAGHAAVILDFDDLVGRRDPVLRAEDVVLANARRDHLTRLRNDGTRLFVHAWRPQISRGEIAPAAVDACFERLRTILGDRIHFACCPHDAGPPVCWCRKPIPGSVIEFARREGVALAQSTVVGSGAADRTMAERIGARFTPSGEFFR